MRHAIGLGLPIPQAQLSSRGVKRDASGSAIQTAFRLSEFRGRSALRRRAAAGFSSGSGLGRRSTMVLDARLGSGSRGRLGLDGNDVERRRFRTPA